MLYIKKSIICICLVLFSINHTYAELSIKRVHDFLDSQTAIYKNASENNIEYFLSFMDDEVKDIHVAYNRTFTGKEHFRKNMPNKAKALLSYERQISQVIIGNKVAIAIYHEQTKEKKKDGKINSYNGKTIVVLDFDDDGLITQMKRYQD